MLKGLWNLGKVSSLKLKLSRGNIILPCVFIYILFLGRGEDILLWVEILSNLLDLMESHWLGQYVIFERHKFDL